MTIKLTNDILAVSILKHGAELASVVDLESGYEYVWQADAKYWGRHAPNLFPIVGRLQDNQYAVAEQDYAMNQHGFARDSEFDVVEVTPIAARLRLVASDATLSFYPLKFQFDVLYELVQDTLKISYIVTNTDTQEIYFSVGGHPAFNTDQAKFDEYQIAVGPKPSYLREILNGPYVDFTQETTFDATQPMALDYADYNNDAIILKLDEQPADLTLSNQNEAHGLTMHVDNAKFVGIWTPAGKAAPFIAIEPWWGVADTTDADGVLAHKYAINKLAVNDTYKGEYSIEFF
ncbi:MAG: aldose 1-epimerase family protein [Lactobacillaceae bacterium]|jgi:galactose mutarotase-like enzyme|nr:aldose 1-epimerase family protein [Lactobacillaceae bacterium]